MGSVGVPRAERHAGQRFLAEAFCAERAHDPLLFLYYGRPKPCLKKLQSCDKASRARAYYFYVHSIILSSQLLCFPACELSRRRSYAFLPRGSRKIRLSLSRFRLRARRLHRCPCRLCSTTRRASRQEAKGILLSDTGRFSP